MNKQEALPLNVFEYITQSI